MKNNLVKIAVIAIVVGLLGFYGGIQYQKSQRGNSMAGGPQGFPNGISQQMGSLRQGNTMRNGSPVSGEITSIDENTITIKIQDGSSKTVVYSDTTKVSKSSTGSKSDLKVGENITAFGQESSGTITAQTISLGDSLFQMGGQQVPQEAK